SNPLFNNTESLDCAWLHPEHLVRVGRSHRGGPTIGYSTDMGKSWQPAGVPFEGAGRGFISVSADGSTWIWAPMGSSPYRSTDCGQTWAPCAGLNVPEIRVESDKINPDYFYAFALEGKTAVLYTSSDAGNSFSREVIPVAVETPAFIANVGHCRGDGRGAQDQVYATPGIFNELWIPSYDGLYHKASGSKTFTRVSSISGIHAFGFGKAHPDADYQTLYIFGELEGKRGIYRSIDKGASWTLINDQAHQFANVFYVIGDPKTYGRVYIGTHGRGTFYGDPKND
ncbi:MAG: hypothetical protein JW739_01480, partial [Opitutales bacterium]|nr:hypothetical protein [Opitutales bacterium]